MSGRCDLTGVAPIVEYRSSIGRYFVTYPSVDRELAMSFESKYTAREIAVNVFCGMPFFTSIPTVPYSSPYPRVHIQYPHLIDPGISLKVVN